MKAELKKRFLNAITLPNYEFTITTPEFRKDEDEFTIWFFEGILEKNPNYVDCLMFLGNAYTSMGMYEKGLSIDQKLSRLKQDDPLIHYNLACSYALLKDIDAAFNALRKAIALGYNDIYHLERDKDLDLLRKDNRYRKLLDKIKNHK
ncbi:MAG: hypothetical protein MRJ65_01160 [Candidatus Brocadiaceae bacterium]|nr:hypothetical protein [Candidatus Brocadiaceae bacterium]